MLVAEKQRIDRVIAICDHIWHGGLAQWRNQNQS